MAATYGCPSNKVTATGRRLQRGQSRVRMLQRLIRRSKHSLSRRQFNCSGHHRGQYLPGQIRALTELRRLRIMAVLTDHHRRQNLPLATIARLRCHRPHEVHTALHLIAVLKELLREVLSTVTQCRERLIARLHIARLRTARLHIVGHRIVDTVIMAHLRSIPRVTIATAEAVTMTGSGIRENRGEIVVPANGLTLLKRTGRIAGMT